MNVNGAFFSLGSLTIQAGASSDRIFNASSGGGISLTQGFTNASTGSQTFNVPIGVDGASGNTVNFRANNGSANTTFAGDFYLNDRIANFGGSSANTSFSLTGTVSGTGQIVKQDSNFLILSGNNTFTGATTINAGTVQVKANNALGTTATGTTVASGATLDFQSVSYSTAEGVTVNGGTIATTTGTSSFAGGVTLGASSIFNVTGTQLTQSGIISDGASTFGITKNGGGILVLGGNNTYKGSTTISAGTLAVTVNNGLGTTANGTTVASGATLDFQNVNYSTTEAVTVNGGTIAASTGTSTFAGAVTLGANSTYNIGATQLTQSGIITDSSSTFGITKTGNGILVLTADNSYKGGTTINAGTVSIGKDLALGSAPASPSAANISFGGGTLAATASFNLDSNRGITLNSGGGTIDVASSQNLAYGGIITGANAFTKSGSGTMTLTGANTYSGATQITGGTLTINAGGNLGNGNSDVTISSGATLNVNTSLTIDSIKETGSSNGGVVAIGTGATLTVDGANKGNLFQNSISGAGNLTLAASGTTVLGLYGTQNYTGTTTVSGGKLSTGVALSSGAFSLTGGTFETTAANLISDTATVTLGGGTFSIGGTETFGNSGVTLTATTTSTVSPTNGVTATVGGALTGSGSLTKSDAGVLVLNAAHSSYSGTTTLSQGTLRLGNDTAIGTGGLTINGGTLASSGSGARSIANNVTMASDLTLGDATGTGDFTLNGTVGLGAASRTFTVNNNLSTIAGAISGNSSVGLTKAGTGTLSLSGANTYTGDTRVSAGTLRLDNNSALGTSGTLNLGVNSSPTAATLLIGSNITNSRSVNVEFGSGTKTLSYGTSGTGAQLGNITLNNSSLAFNVGSGGTLVFGGGVTAPSGGSDVSRLALDGGGTLIVTNSGAGIASTDRYQVRIGNGTMIIGSGTIIARTGNTGLGHGIDMGLDLNGSAVSQAASLLASNNVTVSNSIYVSTASSAARTIGLSGTGAATFSGPIALNNAGLTVTADSGGTATISGAITDANGQNSVTKTGAGIVVLSGANTFSGGSTLSAGTLRLGSAGALGNAGLTINNGTILASDSSTARTFTNLITMGGNVTLGDATGTGALTFSNVNLGQAVRTFTVNPNVTITGVISNGGSTAGGLTKNGGGTLTLSGNNTYSGATTVSAGTLIYNGTNTSTATTVNSGATLMGSGAIGAVTIGSGGTINPGNSPGTLTVGSVTFGGGGNYNWQILNAGAEAGTGYDLLSGTSLNITADSGNKFNINLWSLSSIDPDVNGIATFSSTTPYTWTIGRFSGGITNFNTSSFAINTNPTNGTAGFANTTAGTFAIGVNSTTNLVLTYTPTAVDYSVTVSTGTVDQGAGSGITGGTNQFTGSVGLNKLGAGTLVMTNAANNYTGITTVQAGTLQIDVNAPSGSAGALGNASSAVVIGDTAAATAAGFNIGVANVTNSRALSVVAGTGAADRIIGTTIGSGQAEQAGNINLATNAVLNAASGGTMLYSGVISNSGALTISNSGTSILSGANTYTGATTILTNATLRIANNGALGTTAGGTTVNNGGTLALSNNISTAEGITITGTGLGGGGALRNVSGANTNTGTVTLGASATVGVDNGTSLRLGTIDAVDGTRSLTANVASNGTLLVTGGLLSGTSITNVLQKDGAGEMIISNNGTTGGMQLQVANGKVTLAAGSFSTNTSTTGSSASPRAIDLGLASNGDSTNDAAFYANSGVTVSNSVYVAPNTTNSALRTLGTESTNGTATFSREIYLGGNLNVSAASGGTADFSGAIVNIGNLTKAGSGTVILSANNTFAGGVVVSQGTLVVSNASGAILDTNAVTISSGATLNLGLGERVGSIAGAGNISLNGNQLLAGENNQDTTFSGVMSGTGSFVKFGTGTMTLAGANNFSGQSYLTAGTTLYTVNQGAAYTNTVNLAETSGTNNAVMGLGGTGVTLANPILVRGGSSNNTISIAAQNTTGTAILSGGITLDRNLTITANSGGDLLITNSALVMTNGGNNNDLTITGSNNVTIASAITAPSGASDLNVSGTGTVTLSGNNSANYLKLNLGAAGGTLSVSSLSNLGNTAGGFYGDKINFNGGRLLVTDDLSIAAGTFGMTVSANGGSIEVASGKTFTQNAYVAGTTTAGATFNKLGAGTLVLTDAGNGFGQIFNIQNGTVSVSTTGNLGTNGNVINLGGASTSGTLLWTGSTAATSRTITNNAGGGTINVSNSATALTVNNGIVYNGAFTKAGSGTLILAGAGSGSGAITVGAGVLEARQGSSMGSGNIAVTNGATLQLSSATGMNFANNVNLRGTGATGISGALFNVGGANTNSGGITLDDNSTIGVNAGSLVVSGNVTNNGNNLTLDPYGVSGTSLTVSGAITGSGGLTKIGGGTATLSGSSANTYSGTTTVNAGTLQLAKSGGVKAIASGGTIAINSGGTLLLGAASQINSSNTAISLANSAVLDTAGYADQAGRLSFSGASNSVSVTIKGLVANSENTFIFSDLDTSASSWTSLAPKGLLLTAAAGQSYNFDGGFSIKLFSTEQAGWLTQNNFQEKINFGTTTGAISFGNTSGATYLNVAAIPDARVYTAAVFLLVLIGVTEYRRRRRPCRR